MNKTTNTDKCVTCCDEISRNPYFPFEWYHSKGDMNYSHTVVRLNMLKTHAETVSNIQHSRLKSTEE